MPPIYYGSAPFALKRGSQALNLYYGSTLISGGAALDGLQVLTDKGATLFIPSTATCFSDVGGTTPAVKDGSVARINSVLTSAIYASQGTAGFQPVLRQGAKNLLTYSETYSNAAWIKANLTVSVNQMTTTLVGHALYYQFTAIPGMKYTFQFKAKRGTMTDMAYSVYNVTGAANIIAPTSFYAQTNSADYSLITVQFTAPAGCVSARVYALRDSGVTGTCFIDDCMLEVGTSASAYIATTAAQVSNGVGAWWLDFDGVDDRLDVSAVPWTSTQDQFVSVAARSIKTDCTLFSVRGSTTGSGANGGLSSEIQFEKPNAVAKWRGTDATVIAVPDVYEIASQNVFSARQSASGRSLRKNSAITLEYASTPQTATLAGATIGAIYNATPSGFFAGALYACAFAAATFTNAEASAVDSYLATQAGISGYVMPEFIGSIWNTNSSLYIQAQPTKVISLAGASGSSNYLIREIGNIVYDANADALMRYKIYYSAGPTPYVGNNTAVFMAYAPTLSGAWTKYPSAVIANATLPIEDPYVVIDAGTYHLYGENKTGNSNATGICHFTSSDGITWTRQDSDVSPCFDNSASGWDSKDVSSPVVWIEAGTWYMLYEGREATLNKGKVGLATASSPNGPWTRDAANPVYSGNSGTWEHDDIVPDDIKKVGSTYHLIFHANTGTGLNSGWGVGYVTSDSLSSGWARAAPNQFFGGGYNFEGMWHPDSNKIIAVNGDLGSAQGEGNILAWKLI